MREGLFPFRVKSANSTSSVMSLSFISMQVLLPFTQSRNPNTLKKVCTNPSTFKCCITTDSKYLWWCKLFAHKAAVHSKCTKSKLHSDAAFLILLLQTEISQCKKYSLLSHDIVFAATRLYNSVL